MSAQTDAASSERLLDLYDDALPQVYGYIHRRCRNTSVAEDLTTEVFVGAVDSIKRGVVDDVTIAWLIGIARFKLVDHWRRIGREERKLEAVAVLNNAVSDPWDSELDVLLAREVLSQLGGAARQSPPCLPRPLRRSAAMTAFHQLRDDDRAVAPSSRFARQLRARIEAELSPAIELPARLPNRMDTPTVTDNDTTASAHQVLTPYISVHDGAAALDWYVASLGATETVRYVGDDGRLGHAEFVLNGANIMLSDAYPELGVVAANSSDGSSCALHIEVPNCDAAHELAVAGGAESLQAPADQPHGARSATIMDPFGHRWMLSQPLHALTHEEINANYDDFEVVSRPIQLGYYTMQSNDIAKSAAFYSQLFGWNVDPESGHVDNCDLPFGFQDKFDEDVRLWMTTPDPEPVIARAIELGGRVIEDNGYASGRAVAMVDDQGNRFDLHVPAPGYE